MLKKPSANKKPAQQDLSALDDAVSELSKQTAALWGKPGDTKPKPTLPKRKAQPQPKGKSFDIIHPSKSGTSPKPAHLKTAQSNKQTLLSPEPEALLLPDHAGKSFNEISETDESAAVELASHPTDVPAIINHQEGKLQIAEDTPKPDELPKEQGPTTPASLTSAPSSASRPTAQTAITFEEKEPSSSEPAEKTEKEQQPVPVQDDVYTSGEVFAHNFVKDTEPKRHKPHENQQKPTVFDTNEYHPALHDWSKLEHRSGGKVLILLLLLAVAGVLGYIVISGQKIPFL